MTHAAASGAARMRFWRITGRREMRRADAGRAATQGDHGLSDRGLGSADRVLLCARERKSRRVSPLRRGATNARNGLETLGLGRRVPELLGGGDSVRARVDAELAHDV